MKKEDIAVKKVKRIDYLSPEYLYFKTDDETKYLVDGKSKILKEQLLFNYHNKNIYSTVSGKVLGLKTIDNKNFLVIQNDYKEKYVDNKSLRKKINDLSKKDILDILNESGAEYYSNNIHYFLNHFDSIESLVLSLMVCEDAQKIYSNVFLDYNSEIMEIFDALSQIFEIKSPIIIISDTDDKNIEYISNLSGMYPNLRIVLSHDKYPASHPLLISRKLSLTNSLVLTSMDLYYLYSVIKREKRVLEKEILITGESLKYDYLVNTKLNVLISDLLNVCNIKLKKDEILCKNSAIMGDTINSYDVLNTEIDSIVIAQKDDEKEKECINCGLCNKFCPQKLNPQRYKLSGRPYPGSCIDCNMCSYICPAKIGRKR
ncbi:MAG: 4Fe-4S dicluster domain-containing protein [Bacilli bacterium]|nr:4Fe-4S dicluster domain-containing protein [Bacilli bacterium]